MNLGSDYFTENFDVKENVTFHSFPLNDEQLLQAWMKRIARKDFNPTKYSRLCSLHFKADDFISHSIDQQTRCKQKRPNSLLTKKRLKSDAVPSIFKNISEYYTYKDAPSRSGLLLSSSRLEKEAAELDFQRESFLNGDKITNLDEL